MASRQQPRPLVLRHRSEAPRSLQKAVGHTEISLEPERIEASHESDFVVGQGKRYGGPHWRMTAAGKGRGSWRAVMEMAERVVVDRLVDWGSREKSGVVGRIALEEGQSKASGQDGQHWLTRGRIGTRFWSRRIAWGG